MLSLLPFLYLSLVGTKRARAMDPTTPFMEYLDQNHLVCLKWGFDELQGNITFTLEINTTGWVGFGFSPNGGMHGSDIVMGGLKPSGSYFTDYFATGNTMPFVDSQQSYTLLSLTESDGQTIMTFQRPIHSCDSQDFNITPRPIKLIYAFGQTDDITYHHARRGTKEVNLLHHKSRTSLTNLNYLNVTVDNVTVPPVETHYLCKITKLPTLNTKHHIYLIEPAIENPDIVHHLLLYRCPSDVTEPYESDCSKLGDKWNTCFEVVAIWGVGGKEYELPENTGIPVGGEVRDVFYRLEIHYNNLKKETGRTDSSGLRLYYRPITQPQQLDIGTMTTGLMPGFPMPYNIPPKVTRFHTYGMCNTTQFSKLVNPLPDLQVFAVVLHTHYAGREVRVGHFRNGVQIDFLALDVNYNFELQQIVNLGKIKTIKQGDEIVVECVYSTVNRTKVTKQGLGTYDEMCLAFLLYYPAIKITACLSHPDTNHPLMNTSSQMFEGNLTPGQDEIAKYETLLKSLPQIQVVFDDNFNISFDGNGKIRELMKTPTVATECHSDNASSSLVTSWILTSAGVMLLLLRIAIMFI